MRVAPCEYEIRSVFLTPQSAHSTICFRIASSSGAAASRVFRAWA
jgi:hypothetical protein